MEANILTHRHRQEGLFIYGRLQRGDRRVGSDPQARSNRREKGSRLVINIQVALNKRQTNWCNIYYFHNTSLTKPTAKFEFYTTAFSAVHATIDCRDTSNCPLCARLMLRATVLHRLMIPLSYDVLTTQSRIIGG